MSAERFFVGTVRGFLTMVTSGQAQPGVTACVYDSGHLCALVGQYRSEDQKARGRTRAEMERIALQRAHEHARRLNEEEAHDGILG